MAYSPKWSRFLKKSQETVILPWITKTLSLALVNTAKKLRHPINVLWQLDSDSLQGCSRGASIITNTPKGARSRIMGFEGPILQF